MLNKLLDPANVQILGWLLVLGTPFVGAAMWQAFRAAGRTGPVHRLGACLAGASGVLLMLLWGVFHLVLGLFGFDSVFSIVANVALFAALGAAVGFAFKRLGRPAAPHGEAPEAPGDRAQ